jgi:hypothetical protein
VVDGSYKHSILNGNPMPVLVVIEFDIRVNCRVFFDFNSQYPKYMIDPREKALSITDQSTLL